MGKILVVEDTRIIRETIRASLKQRGYEVFCAGDGKEGLALARKQEPDLVLLDIAMPVMDGITMLELLRGDPSIKHTPVLLLTALSDKHYVLKAAKLGICGYMLKASFSMDDLISRAHDILAPGDKNPSGRSEPGAIAKSAPVGAQRAGPASSGSAFSGSSSQIVEDQLANQQAESLKELKPIMPRSEMQQLLDENTELKGLSPTVAQVLKLSRNPNCSIDEISRVISQDHAIALKVLKMANSSVYSRGETVDSVQKATMRIGLSEITQLVMNIAVMDSFSDEVTNGHLSIPHFWEHSIACGLIASEIVKCLNKSEFTPDSAFTLGLLHDVGRVFYLDLLGDRYVEVLDTAERLKLPVEQVESRMLLINHADAMDRLLHAWRFPRELVNPIAFHQLSMNVIRGQAARNLNEVATLALANRLTHALLLGNSGNQTLYGISDFVTPLKLNPTVISRLEEEIPRQTEDIKYTMITKTNATYWPNYLEHVKERLEEPFRPLFVGENPAINSVRIFCDRLRDVSDEPPNIAVVFANKGREVATLSRNLLSREARLKIQPLPLICLSPAGKLKLEDRVLAGREFACLPLPVTLSRLIENVNRLLTLQMVAG